MPALISQKLTVDRIGSQETGEHRDLQHEPEDGTSFFDLMIDRLGPDRVQAKTIQILELFLPKADV